MSENGSWRRSTSTNTSTAFATDGQISGDNATGAGRQLRRFDGFGSEPLPVASDDRSSLSRDANTFGEDAVSGGRWDQFKENERKFGVTTSFDESEYTTEINRSDPRFAERAAAAERIAREIEGRQSSNPHVQEERGHVLEAADDEEDRFSGVKRENVGSGIAAPAVPTLNGTAQRPESKKSEQKIAEASPPRRSYAAAAGGGSLVQSPPAGGAAGNKKLVRASRASLQVSQSGPGSQGREAIPDKKVDSAKGTTNGSVSMPGQTTRSSQSAKFSVADHGTPRESSTAVGRSQDGPSQVSRKSITGRASPKPTKSPPASRSSGPAKEGTPSHARVAIHGSSVPGGVAEIRKRFEGSDQQKPLRPVDDDRVKSSDAAKKGPGAADSSAASKRGENASAGGVAAKSVEPGTGKPGGGNETEKKSVKEDPKPGDGQSMGGKAKPKRASKPFKFNPAAKSFSLNVDAPEFVPGGSTASDAGASGNSAGGGQFAGDASARIPSSPGMGLEGNMYAQDGAMHPAAAAAAAAAAGIQPIQYIHGQYPPPGAIPAVPYGVHQPQIPPMNQAGLHPGTMMPQGVYPGMQRAPYVIPGPQFGSPVGGTPSRGYGPPVAGAGLPYPPAGGVPYTQGPPPHYMMQQPSQPVGHPVPHLPGPLQGGGGMYAQGQGYSQHFHGGVGSNGVVAGGGGAGDRPGAGGGAYGGGGGGAPSGGSGNVGPSGVGGGARHSKGGRGQRPAGNGESTRER